MSKYSPGSDHSRSYADDIDRKTNGDSIPGQARGGDRRNSASKRKQTLMLLLDALSDMQDEDKPPVPVKTPQIELEQHEGPNVDEQLQTVGAEAFNKFQRRISELDKELRNFSNASRQLGSSVGILSSAFHLRERLAQILYLFRENAHNLFPRKVPRRPRDLLVNPAKIKQSRSHPTKRYADVVNPPVSETLDAEDFPKQLADFAEDVTAFLRSLNEFPEFTDETVNNSILSLDGDLKYWASCLKSYTGQFRYPAVQRYIHDLTLEMGEHLDTISSALSVFLEVGIPTIRFAQKHAASNLLNLTTIATFFSAVTATTLQFSFNQTEMPLSDAVNGFWFCSLVFSVASAVNSLLGLTWKQAMYRSPGHRVPWWVIIWIKRSPLVFLVVSVAAFSIGLCVFAYASKQHPVTAALTTVFTAFSSFGLIAVSAWFVFERWAFRRHRGKKWLMDVIAEIQEHVHQIPVIGWLYTVPPRHVRIIGKRVRKATTSLGAFAARLLPSRRSVEQVTTTRPVPLEKDDAQAVEPQSPVTPNPVVSITVVPDTPTSPNPLGSVAAGSTSDTTLLAIPDANDSPLKASMLGKTRFASAVRSVIVMRAASSAAGGALTSPTTSRQRTGSSTILPSETRLRPDPFGMRGSRAAAIVAKLKSLEPTQDLTPHQALVRHLQFSPNGKFLATCSWDRTCVVFNVEDPFSVHRVLAHPSGFVGQVAWSPIGDLLMTKMNRGVKIWSTDSGVCRNTIDRHCSVMAITWYHGGEAFLSVEDNTITKLDLNGNVLDSYRFPKMKFHDVAITPDGQRMLGVATLLASPVDGLQPSKSRAEKQIIVYNLDCKEIENRVPVLHDIRDITLARNGKVALVSYEDKAPPQLWRIEMVRDRHHETHVAARLSLQYTYMPKTSVEFAGPSYFGGKDDQLVLCAGKTGDIHIWERETSVLLHHIRGRNHEGELGLTCIAWNHAAEQPMFSTGSHDGSVRVWAIPPDTESTVLGLERTDSPVEEEYESEDEDFVLFRGSMK